MPTPHFTFAGERGFNNVMASVRSLLPVPFDELMKQHEGGVMRYLLRVTGDREDAADLFQETWLRAYRAYPRLRPDSQIRPWLYAIAANLCRNHFRNGARRARVIAPDNDPSPDSARSGNVIGSSHGDIAYAAVHLRSAISRLPAKQREAIVLRCFAGLEYTEIATVLECSKESARANVSQAIRKLKSAR